MRVMHPRTGDGPGVPPAAVDVNGDARPVDEDGTFEGGTEGWLQRFADRHDADPEDLRVDDADDEDDDSGADGADAEDLEADGDDVEPGETICTCDVGEACDECGGQCPTVKSDGDVCGRDRPCTYHDNDDSEE